MIGVLLHVSFTLSAQQGGNASPPPHPPILYTLQAEHEELQKGFAAGLLFIEAGCIIVHAHLLVVAMCLRGEQLQVLEFLLISFVFLMIYYQGD